MKLPPVIPVPLEHLDPQTPKLIQLVSQWQKLWHMAVTRQNRLDQHQTMLREVTAIYFLIVGLSGGIGAIFLRPLCVKVGMLCLSM